jgi:hypothetical protein
VIARSIALATVSGPPPSLPKAPSYTPAVLSETALLNSA